jgi:hypothetical protein
MGSMCGTTVLYTNMGNNCTRTSSTSNSCFLKQMYGYMFDCLCNCHLHSFISELFYSTDCAMYSVQCTHSACSFSGRVIGLANGPLFGLYCALVGPNPRTLRMAANELLDLLCFSYVYVVYVFRQIFFSWADSFYFEKLLERINRFLRNICRR